MYTHSTFRLKSAFSCFSIILLYSATLFACQSAQTQHSNETYTFDEIESRITRDKVGGITTAFLQTPDQDSLVYMYMKFRFGNEKELMNRDVAGDFAGQLLMRGTKKHTREELEAAFDRLGAKVNLSGDVYSVWASITVPTQNLYETLSLIKEVLQEPAYSNDEFEQLKKEVLAILDNFKDDASSIAGRAMGQYMNSLPEGHPNYSGSLEGSIKAISEVTLDETRAFHKDFYGASNGQITVAGSFDEVEFTSWLNKNLVTWESPAAYGKSIITLAEKPPINRRINAKTKNKAHLTARQNLYLNNTHPDYPALLMGAYLLGNPAFSESRLANVFKDNESGDRLMSVFFASPINKLGGFMVFGNFDAANLDQIEDVFQAQIAGFISKEITPNELEAAKQHWFDSREGLKTNYSRLVSHINNALYLERTLEWDAELETKVMELSPSVVHSAIRRHIKQESLSVVAAGDFQD